MLNFPEGMRDLCCDMLWLGPMETEKARRRKSFLLSEKKSNAKEQFYNSISDALRDLETFNEIDLMIDLTMLVYENRQNAINFARADNPLCCEHWNIYLKLGFEKSWKNNKLIMMAVLFEDRLKQIK